MVDPGREAERNDRAYDAPVSGLSYNWNSTTIYVRPGEKAGEKAAAFVDPVNDYVSLKNEVVTSKNGNRPHRRSQRRRAAKTSLLVSGKVPVGSTKNIFTKTSRARLFMPGSIFANS